LTNGPVLRFALGNGSGGCDRCGKSPVEASDEQRVALAALAGLRDRGEADRARAVLLTLAGWTRGVSKTWGSLLALGGLISLANA
jgi:hypothetical protein